MSILSGSISYNFFLKYILKTVSLNLPTEYSKLALTVLLFLCNIQTSSFMLLQKWFRILSLNAITFLITFQFNFPVSSTIINSAHCLHYISLIIFLIVVAERRFFSILYFYYIYIRSSIDQLSTEHTKLKLTVYMYSSKGCQNLLFICKKCENRICSKYPTILRSSLIIDKVWDKMSVLQFWAILTQKSFSRTLYQ